MKQLLIAAFLVLAACNTNTTTLNVPFNAYEWASSQVDIALKNGAILQDDYPNILETVEGIDYFEFDNLQEFKDYVIWVIETNPQDEE